MKTTATIALARSGFEAVRWCLVRGETATALDVASALHDLPEDEDDFLYLGELTVLRLQTLMKKYPDHPAIQILACHLQSDRIHKESQ
ncbi:MAG TPA: hypothetical protein ENJ91_10880 [Rhodobacteraceae bacterium]|nr:hypothetical protein [Paracoccaceae bacterium]